jgi:predicted negative regulator of RcsB-dependent stress response
MVDIGILISSLLGIATFGWTAYQYFDTRKRDQNLKEFEIYHKLIKELVQPDEKNVMFVDRQTAIIYELRNFKRYYSFSYRTLCGLREKWNRPDQFPRLIEELDLTIKFLEKKNKQE